MQRNPRYKALLFSLYLIIPLFMLNLWIMEHGILSKLLEAKNVKWIIAISAFTLFNFYFLYRVKKIGFYLILSVCFFIFSLNLSKLVFEKNYALGFYALFILILAVTYLFHLYEELQSSFYQSGQRWFEGKPRLLAEIMIEFDTTSGKIKGELSKIDSKGCFALFDQTFDKKDLNKFKITESFLCIGNHRLSVQTNPMTAWVGPDKKVAGMGLKFEIKNSDSEKDLLDFLDRVRSYGYAL